MSIEPTAKGKNESQPCGWVGSLDQGWCNVSKVSRPFLLSPFGYYFSIHMCLLPCPLLTTILWSIFDPCLSSHHISRNSWNLLSFTGLETSLTRGPEKLVVSSVIKEIVRRCDYRFELSESLGRKEGTETENSHHWTMIQSICLFNWACNKNP